MHAPQIAGFAVTTAVVLSVDLPIDWLVVTAMLAGGVTTLIVAHVTKTKR